jgi:hypothetical protein
MGTGPAEEAEKGASMVNAHGHPSRHVSSADEYEHMKPGVTKGNSQSPQNALKPPEYEEPKVCNSNSSASLPAHQEAEYATPSPVTKQKEATYDLPNSTKKSEVNVASATPQISLVASASEEHLTTGRGKSPSPSGGEDNLKPFKIERDCLGVSLFLQFSSPCVF